MKEILLTQGKVSIVDDNNFEWLSQWKWYYSGEYAVREVSRGNLVYMHRLIANTPDGMQTDHKNRNKLDNRRENLRICTKSQNRMNSNKSENNTSGFRGVTWHKYRKKWQAQIVKNGKRIYLGHFVNLEDAARAYDKAAKLYHEDFCELNFPNI